MKHNAWVLSPVEFLHRTKTVFENNCSRRYGFIAKNSQIKRVAALKKQFLSLSAAISCFLILPAFTTIGSISSVLYKY